MNYDHERDSLAAPILPADSTNSEHAGAFIPGGLAEYTLTIGEASYLMQSEQCKFASNRKVQRMCRDGTIDCFKLQTTRNGQPVAEWLVNEASLRNHIEKNEIKWDVESVIPPYANGNASHSPNVIGNANANEHHPIYLGAEPDAMAMPNRDGNASGGTNFENSQAVAGKDVATPEEDGDAIGDEPDGLIGERRSLASLLIENAGLTAELQGMRNLIGEIRDDKEFLRDELREARAGRKDVAAIAERMLETLETIAVGGRLMPPTRKPDEHFRSAERRQLQVREVDNQPGRNDGYQI